MLHEHSGRHRAQGATKPFMPASPFGRAKKDDSRRCPWSFCRGTRRNPGNRILRTLQSPGHQCPVILVARLY